MAKKQDLKKGIKKKKKDIISQLKNLTSWLCSNHDVNVLERFISYYDINKSMLHSRISTYCFNNLHVIKFINKYLNDLYKFYGYDEKEMLLSFAYLMKLNGINKPNKFFYLKSMDFKDKNKDIVKNLVKRYFILTHNKTLNNKELNHYYNLFLKGKITSDNLEEINTLLNGNDTQLKIEPLNQESINDLSDEKFEDYFNEIRSRDLSKNIQKFITEIENDISESNKCKSCKLCESEKVILDTNLDDIGPVDVVFVALNPGKTETVFHKPLIGRAGKYHRKYMFFMPPGTRWMITNVILSSTPNQKDIGKDNKQIMKVVNNCKDNLQKILSSFPSKLYVPMGGIAAEVFGIKGSIIANSGKIHDINGKKIIPLVHPSAVIQYHGKMEEAYKLSFQEIYNYLRWTVEKSEDNIKLSDSHISNNITTNKSLDNISINNDFSDCTLFDVCNINGKQVVLIFIDKNGSKKYKMIDYQFPIYINEKDWKENDMLISDVTSVAYVNGYELSKIKRQLYELIELSKNSVTKNR